MALPEPDVEQREAVPYLGTWARHLVKDGATA